MSIEQSTVEKAPPIKETATEPVVQKPDVPVKPVEESTSTQKTEISAADIKAAEKAAKEAKRDPVPATSVGWKQIGDWEEKDALTQEDELIDLATPTLLDSYLPEKLYGDWYHTVAVFIVAGLLSFIVGWFGFSLAPVFFIVLIFSIYYRTSIKKYRSVVRDEIQKEFTIKHIENDYETMDWLNTFLEKFWIYLEPSVSQIVTEQVNPIVASIDAIPAFVKAVWIDEFTVGTKPPRIDFVKTLEIAKDDVVVMDWAFSFTPHETADLSSKQLKNYVNQRVVVKAKLFGVTIPVVVENFAVRAWARVRIHMTPSFPHIETVNVSLMEPPQFDFSSKLLGESILNWEILSFPGLLPLINEMALKFAGPMLFKPFSFELNVPQLLSGANTSVGILSLNIKSAKNLKAAERVFGNTIDPYLTFSTNGKDVLGKTKTILDTLSPTWNETIHILVGSFSDPLIVTLYDYNDDRKDKKLGQLQIDLNELFDQKTAENQVGSFLRNSKHVGDLLFDYEFSPTLEPTQTIDGTIEQPKELNTGLTKIELKELRNVKTLDGKKLTQYTEVYFNNELMGKSGVTKNNDEPSFSVKFETIVTDRRKANIKILTKDAKGKLIGASIQSLNSLIDRTEIDREWVPFTKGEGEFKISTIWKSVEISNVPGVGGYTEPIGVVRVLLNKAEGLRNLEAVGKSDPYARVLVNNVVRGRTDLIESNLDPVWNEVIFVPVTSPNQKLTIEVMDAERNHDDRSLGSFDIKTSDFIEKNDQGDKYLEYIDEELRTGKLVHKKGPKGIVTYALSFYPTLPVKSLEDIEEEQKLKQKKEAEKLQAKSSKSKDKKKVEEEDEDFSETNKVELPLTELINYSTGLFAFTIIAGEYNNSETFLQVYFDNHGYPDYNVPINRKIVTVPQTGDCLVKELEWSNITFRIVKKHYFTRVDEAIAESTIPVLSLLKNTYQAGNILTLNGAGSNKLKIQSQWIPVLVSKLPESDLITNSGDLDLDIVSASNLISADSNGKSDPFVKVYLNDEEDSFFKTNTIKKTLDPVWNEKTSVEVSNRVNSVLRFNVRDKDFGTAQDDKLGEAILDLGDIDPINPSEHVLTIQPPSGHSGDAGTLRVKTSFRPKYIVKVHEQSTNIGDIGLKTIGTGLGTGIGVGKTVIGGGVGVGKSVIGGVGRVKGIFGKKDKDKEER